MKTIYRRKTSSSERTQRIFLVLGIFLVGVIFFSFFRGQIIGIFSPLWKGNNFVSHKVSSISEFFISKDTLIKENESLRSELVSYDAQILAYRASESTFETLLNTYGRGEDFKGIAASVLTHPPATPYDVLVIDAGEGQGVKVGDKVTLPEGSYLGKVTEVGRGYSRVILFSTGGEKTEAVLERGNLPITLIGKSGGTFEFVLPQSANVVVGDRILSPGLNQKLVAVVGDVAGEPTDAFKKVLAGIPANIFTLRFVTVLP